MYKMRVWKGPGKDYFIQIIKPKDPYWQRSWCLVDSLDEASELSIEWIQQEIGLIYEIENPELLEILQVREHSS